MWTSISSNRQSLGRPLMVILYFYFHKRIRTPFKSWTSSYKGLETLLAKRRLNLFLCGFSQKCKVFVFCSILFHLHFVWKPDVGRKDLVPLTDSRSVNLWVFRKAPARAIKPWIKNDVYLKSVPTWDCLMLWCGRALGEQPDQEMLYLQPPFISNIAIHQMWKLELLQLLTAPLTAILCEIILKNRKIYSTNN